MTNKTKTIIEWLILLTLFLGSSLWLGGIVNADYSYGQQAPKVWSAILMVVVIVSLTLIIWKLVTISRNNNKKIDNPFEVKQTSNKSTSDTKNENLTKISEVEKKLLDPNITTQQKENLEKILSWLKE